MPNPSNNKNSAHQGDCDSLLQEPDAGHAESLEEFGKELKASLKKELLEEIPNVQSLKDGVAAQVMKDLPRLVLELSRASTLASTFDGSSTLHDSSLSQEIVSSVESSNDKRFTDPPLGPSKEVSTSSIGKSGHRSPADPPLGKKKSRSLSRSFSRQHSRPDCDESPSNLVVDNDGGESVGELCMHTKSDGAPILDFEANERGAQDWVYAWAETMWDAMPFIGLNVMPFSDSALVVIVAILNIVIQGVFIGLVGANMTTSPFQDNELVETLQDWRVSYAHNPDFADKFTNTPLAKDICSRSSFQMQGAQQAGLYNEVIEYIQIYLGMPAGACLSVLAIFLWVLTCSKEMKRICLFCVGLWTPPWDSRSVFDTSMKKSYVVVQERSVMWLYGEPFQKNYQLFVTSWRVLCMTFFVVLPRLVILVTLCFIGSQFLVATTELDELILNCVALEVILNVDELLFIIFAPDAAARMVRKTKPLRVPKLRGARARVMPWIRLFVIAIIMCCIGVFSLMPLIDTMMEVERVMCGGDVNFLAREMVFGSVVSGTATIAGIVRSSYRYRAIYDRTGLGQSTTTAELPLSIENNMFEFELVKTLDVWSERSFVDWATLDYVDRTYLGCWDQMWVLMGSSHYANAIFSGISSLLGVEGISSCQQLKPWCFSDISSGGNAVRLLCPSTCGGNNPLSGLMIARTTDGLPENCGQDYTTRLSQLPCTDYPLSILRNASHPVGEGWNNYAESGKGMFIPFLQGWAAGNATLYHELLHQLGNGMMKYGCDFFSPTGPNAASGGMVMIGPSWQQYPVDFCNTRTAQLQGARTIRPFCPQTCKCNTDVKEWYAARLETWNDRTGFESECPKACWSSPTP